MKISVTMADYSWPDGPAALARHLAEVASAADDAGLDTVWVPDHLLQANHRHHHDAEMVESYTTLGYLAAHSTRVRLGTMVTAVTWRPPALLIKAVTTIDVLSGGRAWLGVGAGYHLDEARAMGLPLPSVTERFEALEDTLRLARQMWSSDHTSFAGHHHRAERPVNQPQAIQQPHPPILIGGMGERKTLPLVARYGDACNLFDVPDGGVTLRRKIDILDRCCHDVARDPAEVEKTVSTRLTDGETAEAFAGRCVRLAELGINHAVVLAEGPWTEERLEVLATARRHLNERERP